MLHLKYECRSRACSVGDVEVDFEKTSCVANTVTPVELPASGVGCPPRARAVARSKEAEVFGAWGADRLKLIFAEVRCIVGRRDGNDASTTTISAIFLKFPAIASRKILFNCKMSSTVESQSETLICQFPERCGVIQVVNRLIASKATLLLNFFRLNLCLFSVLRDHDDSNGDRDCCETEESVCYPRHLLYFSYLLADKI